MKFINVKNFAKMLVPCIALCCSVFARAAGDDKIAGQLPEDWFVLPEDKEAFDFVQSQEAAKRQSRSFSGLRDIFKIDSVRRGEEYTARAFDRILEANANALEKTPNLIGIRSRPDNTPPDWVPWHLHELLLRMGVTAQGTLGVIGVGADLSAEIYWRRQEQAKRALGLVPMPPVAPALANVSEEKADFVVTDTMSSDEIERKIAPVTKMVLATGKVKNQGRLQAGLVKVAKELQDVMSDINFYNSSSWEVSTFALIVTVNASGIVYHGVSVGGQVQLRFIWKKTAPGYTTVSAGEPSCTVNTARREAMRITTANLGRDLDSITSELYSSSGFYLQTIVVGIGAFFSGNVGVVTGRVGAIGAAFFTKVQSRNYAPHPLPPVLAELDLPFITNDQSPKHMSFAQANSVEFVREFASSDPKHPSGSDKVIYYLNRPRFRAGLRKAAKVGAFFAQRSSRIRVGQWHVDEVRPFFALSLMGNLGVGTLGGNVVMELRFRRNQQ